MKLPCSSKCQPTAVLLPGKCHRQRSLAGYSPWGRKELDATEHTHMQPKKFPISIWQATRKGNRSKVQSSCMLLNCFSNQKDLNTVWISIYIWLQMWMCRGVCAGEEEETEPRSSKFCFVFFLIYLFAPSLSCGTRDLWSLLQHVGSLTMCVVSSSLTRDGTWAPCLGNLES